MTEKQRLLFDYIVARLGFEGTFSLAEYFKHLPKLVDQLKHLGAISAAELKRRRNWYLQQFGLTIDVAFQLEVITPIEQEKVERMLPPWLK